MVFLIYNIILSDSVLGDAGEGKRKIFKEGIHADHKQHFLPCCHLYLPQFPNVSIYTQLAIVGSQDFQDQSRCDQQGTRTAHHPPSPRPRHTKLPALVLSWSKEYLPSHQNSGKLLKKQILIPQSHWACFEGEGCYHL